MNEPYKPPFGVLCSNRKDGENHHHIARLVFKRALCGTRVDSWWFKEKEVERETVCLVCQDKAQERADKAKARAT